MTILTPEQEALIPVYQEKWKAIALSTEPINRQRAEAAIKAVYAIMGKNAPQIRFCSSPYEASLLKLESKKNPVNSELFLAQSKGIWKLPILDVDEKVQKNPLRRLSLELTLAATQRVRKIIHSRISPDIQLEEISEDTLQRIDDIWNELNPQNGNSSITEFSDLVRKLVDLKPPKSIIKVTIKRRLTSHLSNRIKRVNWIGAGLHQLDIQRYSQDFGSPIREKYTQKFYPCCSPIANILSSIWLDFCISVLHIPVEKKRWEVFASFVKECGWIFCAEEDENCVVCDRPRILRFDNEQNLHAEGEPAIQFADGFSVYVYHGVRLPEEYGKLHPSQWQSNWLLSEENAELRRVLIQGIGYAKLCQELQATQLDTWQEYQLLRINGNLDGEPMHLLKMTCPSTGYIHAMRVPPNVRSARNAIKWVNWGVEPEEFSSQS